MRTLMPWLLFAVLLLSLGCRSGQAEDLDALPEHSTSEHLTELEGVLANLQALPYAQEITPEVEQARTLLVEAKTRLAEDDEDELIPVVVTALEQQLVLIRTYIRRRKAEDNLETLRLSHEAQSTELQAQRQRADQAIEALRDTPEGGTP